MNTQKMLSLEQVVAFHHDLFVKDQVRSFVQLLGTFSSAKQVIDMGGGCGFFARSLAAATNFKIKVVDMDPASVQACRDAGIGATQGDATEPQIVGDEEIVTFNLVLHHLVADTELGTLALQRRALAAWVPHAKAVFVNEYIYDSFVGNLSGWLIYQITKSVLLSAIGRAISKLVPSLKANTFGVGVRFRSHHEWCKVFESAGFTVKRCVFGEDETVSLARRVLFIRKIRRDSFLLIPNPHASEREFVRAVCAPCESFDPESPRSIAGAVRRFVTGHDEIASHFYSAPQFVTRLLACAS